MSAKFDKFQEELIALCERHGVQLSTSMHDTMEAWDWNGKDEILYAGLDDRTGRDGGSIHIQENHPN